MITCFKFKDIIDITYHSNTDTLYFSLSDSWLQENSLFKNSKDYMLEYEKRTTDNKEDLENNIVSVILKLYHEEDFCYISGCYFEHFVSRFNKKISVYDYDCEQRSRVDCEHHLIVDNLAIDMTWEYLCENAPFGKNGDLFWQKWRFE